MEKTQDGDFKHFANLPDHRFREGSKYGGVGPRWFVIESGPLMGAVNKTALGKAQAQIESAKAKLEKKPSQMASEIPILKCTYGYSLLKSYWH